MLGRVLCGWSQVGVVWLLMAEHQAMVPVARCRRVQRPVLAFLPSSMGAAGPLSRVADYSGRPGAGEPGRSTLQNQDFSPRLISVSSITW